MPNNLELKKILSYDDVVKYPAGESQEALVDATKYDSSIITKYLKEDMLEITGDVIYIRDELAKKLALVNKALASKGCRLKVVYGYRHPEVQERYFERRKNEVKGQLPSYSNEEIDRYTHNFVAVPDVAGHPAAAAIDLTVVDSNGKDLDMGSMIADYSDPSKIITFSDDISESQATNRLILHNAMVEQDFAPFYGEWWHFSYGDREWAAFYNKKALYGAVKFKN